MGEHETSDKLEGPQRVCGDTPFQNGRSAHPERPKKRRLDDEDRSEGCILHDTNPQQRRTIPSLLHHPRQLSVQLPTIRPVLCFLDLYQDPEASGIPAQRAGNQASGIHRRHSSLCR